MIFAVTVPGLSDGFGFVRNHTAGAEDDCHVANVLADPLVQGLGLVAPVGEASRDLVGKSLNRGCHSGLGSGAIEVGLACSIVVRERRYENPRTDVKDTRGADFRCMCHGILYGPAPKLCSGLVGRQLLASQVDGLDVEVE